MAVTKTRTRARSKPERRRWEKQLRRRRRKAAEGPARKHWDRRRRGTANSAPELRHRSAILGIEDHLIGGRIQRRASDPEKRLNRLFRGIVKVGVEDRYEALERARQIELERAREAAAS